MTRQYDIVETEDRISFVHSDGYRTTVRKNDERYLPDDMARTILDTRNGTGERVRIAKVRTFCGSCREEAEYHLFADADESLALSERAVRAWCAEGRHGAPYLIAVVLATRFLTNA